MTPEYRQDAYSAIMPARGILEMWQVRMAPFLFALSV